MADEGKRHPGQGGEVTDKANSNTHATIRLTGYEPTESEINDYLADNPPLDPWGEYISALHSQDENPPRTLGLFTSAYYLTGKHVPKKPVPLIDGILSRRAKLLITAPPKAGKSYLGIDLAMAVVSGSKWLDRFQCRKSPTLYLNAEIDGDEFANRMEHIRKERGYTPEEIADLYVLDTLGVCNSIDDVVKVVADAVDQALEANAQVNNLAFVVIDPLYMFEEGSENDSEIIIKLMRALDPLLEAGLSIALIHHQPKGDNVGNRPLTDRAAGSNAFTRNAHQMLDLTYKVLDKGESAKLAAKYGEKARALRLEYGGRSFAGGELSVVWNWPLFVIDEEYSKAPVEGSHAARRTRGANKSRETSEKRRANNAVLIDRAYRRLREEGADTKRKTLYEAYCDECETEGVKVSVEFSSFSQWFTPSKAKYNYRTDVERDNQLFKINDEGDFID